MSEAAQLAGGEAALNSKKEREQTSLREYGESLLVTIILALFGTTFVVQAFKIPSPSMEPTLLVGDHLLVNKFIFGGTGSAFEKILPYRAIRRGDVLVFKFPYGDHAHYVKRVIGLPGDRLRIADQQVFVNGAPLLEPYKVHDDREAYDPFGSNFPPTNRHFLRRNVQPQWAQRILDHVEGYELVVPPDRYFVMGDNRDHSLDSRYWGFVDRQAVMGRPMVIYWSVDATSADYSDRSIVGRIIGLLDTLVHLPVKTRWWRMFHGVH